MMFIHSFHFSKLIVKLCQIIYIHEANMYPSHYVLRNRDVTQIGVDFIDCINFHVP